MKNKHSTLFVFVGGWLSLVALVIGGSMLLPSERSLTEASTALLYRYAGGDAPVHNRIATDLGRVIIADLETMKLTLYEEGVLIKTFPILSKGKPGTPWETPTGNYTIQAREVKHRSSIGGTWMPYSMQFYGNFFIHGWPTYDDGRDVPLGYSGGCIRLATDDAREVYEFTPRGSQVVVTGSKVPSSASSTAQYYLRGEGALPEISARALSVQDVHSRHILFERDAHESIMPRGLARIMTALTALETVNQYKIVRMSELLLGASVLRRHSIGAIDEMPAGVLIYPLLFGANDTAAKVFASEHGEKQFVRYMNEKSMGIGMSESIFAGPLSTDISTSTAHDLSLLLAYAKANKNFIIDATLIKEKALFDTDGEERFVWKNRNPWVLAGDGSFRGGIADIDDAGQGSAMLLFDIPMSEFSSRTVSFVIIDSLHLEEEVLSLRRFVSENFVYGFYQEDTLFIKEEGDVPLNILEKAKTLIDFEGWLRGGGEVHRT